MSKKRNVAVQFGLSKVAQVALNIEAIFTSGRESSKENLERERLRDSVARAKPPASPLLITCCLRDVPSCARALSNGRSSSFSPRRIRIGAWRLALSVRRFPFGAFRSALSVRRVCFFSGTLLRSTSPGVPGLPVAHRSLDGFQTQRYSLFCSDRRGACLRNSFLHLSQLMAGNNPAHPKYPNDTFKNS